MIVILVRGKTQVTIGSPTSEGWIQPGDRYFPCTILKSSGAFMRRWKELKKKGFKDFEYISVRPKQKKSTQKYVVKVAGTQDKLLNAFAAWLKTQIYGSVGYFELITGKIPKPLTNDDDLVKYGRSFIDLPEGSRVVTDANGRVRMLDSEGGRPQSVARDLRSFLVQLSKGKTGVPDLDQEGSGRQAMAQWLKGVK